MVLSTDQGLITYRNAADAHVQDLVVSDEFLLCILSASDSTLTSTRNVPRFHFVVPTEKNLPLLSIEL